MVQRTGLLAALPALLLTRSSARADDGPMVGCPARGQGSKPTRPTARRRPPVAG